MVERSNILAKLASHKDELAAQFPVRRLGLFGSYARGEQTPASDVDILVDVDASIGLGFVTLAERLESILGLHVDLVSTRALKPRQAAHIQRDIIYV